MDYEDIANFSNLTSNEDVTPGMPKIAIVQEIIFTLICLVAICADALIIHITFRYRRMRTVPNIIMANWAITDLCYLLFLPIIYRFILICDSIPRSTDFLCIIAETGAVVHITNLMFTLMISIDWCLAAHFEKFSKKFKYYYKFVIASIWALTFITTTISSGFCIRRRYIYFLHGYTFVFAYSTVFVSAIVLQSHRAIQKCREKLQDYPHVMLTVVTGCVFCGFLAYVGLLIFAFTGKFYQVLGLIASSALFSTSMVNLVILYCYNNDFQACFLQFVKRTSNKYEEADFVFHNPVRESVVEQPAQISSSSSEEQISIGHND